MTDWIKEVEKEKEKIKKWKTEDRLSYLAKLTFMNGTVASSVAGWQQWLSNAITMQNFSEEELKKLVDEFEKIALAFLDLDIKYTKFLKNRLEKKKKKETKEKKSYIS